MIKSSIREKKRKSITMSVNLKLIDDQFPFTKVTHTRIVCRAIVLNDLNQVGFCNVVRDDIFGHCEYLETPGGGKEENETLTEGVIRELDEEIGYRCKVISELGVVEDYYNLIFRKNINHYFLCKIDSKTKIHHESKGDDFIKGIVWISIDEAIERYSSLEDKGLLLLIKRRELPILKEAKKQLQM